MAVWYTVNGISGTPTDEMIHLMASYFEKKGAKVFSYVEANSVHNRQLFFNTISSYYPASISTFTETLLSLTWHKEIFDHINWKAYDIVITKGSFLETLGYSNQLADLEWEDAIKVFFLFMKYIGHTYPALSIVLTEHFDAAEQRAYAQFEYRGKKEVYAHTSKCFLQIQEHPLVRAANIKVINVEVNGKEPLEAFKQEIEPLLA